MDILELLSKAKEEYHRVSLRMAFISLAPFLVDFELLMEEFGFVCVPFCVLTCVCVCLYEVNLIVPIYR